MFPQSLVSQEHCGPGEETGRVRRKEQEHRHTGVPSMVVYPCSPGTWEAKARSTVAHPPQLHGEFEANLGYLPQQQQKEPLKTALVCVGWSEEMAQWLIGAYCSCGGPELSSQHPRQVAHNHQSL